MAISSLGFVLTQATGGVASLAFTLPAGISAGSLLKAIVTQDGNGQILTQPAGWTLDTNTTISNGDRSIYIKITRVCDGSEGATATVTSTATAIMAAVCGGWNGCDNTIGSFAAGERDYQVNSPNSVSAPASPVTLVANSITPNAGDQIALLAGVDTSGNNGVYSALPGGFSTIVQSTSTQQFSSCMGADAAAAGGATGTVNATWTQVGNSGNFVTYFMALKSASPPAPAQPFTRQQWFVTDVVSQQ